MNAAVRKYLSGIGSRGGRKSRRSLSTQDARLMVRLREARRAYRDFHTQCFWSFPPDLEVKVEDISWVAEQLRKLGGISAWRAAAKLCL